MACLSNYIKILAISFVGLGMGGCVSLQIEKISKGAEVLPPPGEFVRGKTSLQEVLSRYGAPGEVVPMKDLFALYYQRSLYRGADLSIGIPLSDVWLPGPNLESRANLARYDTAVFIFTPEGILQDLKYEKGTSAPLWDTFWK